MNKVILHGELGKEFGTEHNFHINSPIEAIRALSANYSEFRPYLIEHSEPGYRIVVEDEEFALEELAYPVNRPIHIVPVIAGAGGGFGKIVLGAALIVASGGLANIAAGALVGAGTGTVAGVSATAILGTVVPAMSKLGLAIALGGASQILFAPPKKSTNAVEANKNTGFDGPVNLTSQGVVVPVAYGQVMVGSVVIGGSLITSSQMMPNTLTGLSASPLDASNIQISWKSASANSAIDRIKIFLSTDKNDPEAGDVLVEEYPKDANKLTVAYDLSSSFVWVWVQSVSIEGETSNLAGPVYVYKWTDYAW